MRAVLGSGLGVAEGVVRRVGVLVRFPAMAAFGLVGGPGVRPGLRGIDSFVWVALPELLTAPTTP